MDSTRKKKVSHNVRKFLEGLEVGEDDLSQFGDPDEMKSKLAAIIATKTQVSSCIQFLLSFKIYIVAVLRIRTKIFSNLGCKKLYLNVSNRIVNEM
jgi:hypothetical protein